MTSFWKRTGMIGSTIGAVTAALLLSASPASAVGDYSGLAYIQGGGAYTDDWNDEGVLSTTSHASSNATCLWQKVLWSEGFLPWNGIDGVFGNDTRDATIAYQQAHFLKDDGLVGKESFTHAGQFLADTNSDGSVDTYVGTNGRTFVLKRDANNRYTFYDRSGNLRDAGYDYLTCS